MNWCNVTGLRIRMDPHCCVKAHPDLRESERNVDADPHLIKIHELYWLKMEPWTLKLEG